jgi:hypothetical protein
MLSPPPMLRSRGYGTFNSAPVTWGALVSTSSGQQAINLIADDGASIWSPSGYEIAANVDELFDTNINDNSLINPINNSGNAGASGDNEVWTGTNYNGNGDLVSSDTLGSSKPETGIDYTQNFLWSAYGTSKNTTELPVYAFSNELTTAVPEPTSLGIVGIAITGLLARRRRV